MKANERIIDPVQDYIMYEFTGETELQNNIGDFQTLYKVKVLHKYPTKKGKHEWKFYKTTTISESYVEIMNKRNSN